MEHGRTTKQDDPSALCANVDFVRVGLKPARFYISKDGRAKVWRAKEVDLN